MAAKKKLRKRIKINPKGLLKSVVRRQKILDEIVGTPRKKKKK